MQVPIEPPTSQASHWPVQPALQQTPSAQNPEPHSTSEVHEEPNGFEQVPSPFALHFSPLAQDEVVQHTPSTQLPLLHCAAEVHTVPRLPVVVQVVPLQKYPLAQSESPAQLVLHAAPPHTYGSHLAAETGAQLPRPSQVRVGVAEPEAQVAAAQTAPVPGGAPHLVRSEPVQLA